MMDLEAVGIARCEADLVSWLSLWEGTREEHAASARELKIKHGMRVRGQKR